MHCTRATHQFQLYLDHQLTLRQTRVLEAHIATCPSCRAELALLEEVSRGLDSLKFVPEPTDMHEQIMLRVAMTTARKQQLLRAEQKEPFTVFHPSLSEILAAAFLATMATLIVLLQQPTLRALLPVANGHDPLSLFYMQIIHMLTSADSSTVSLALWAIGTLLGVLITLMVAGSEMRTQWFKAMLGRLPVR